MNTSYLLTNPAVIAGLLFAVLATVFYTSSLEIPFWKKFYAYVPALLLCYFLPSLLNTFELIDNKDTTLYKFASRYLLPTSLVLFTVSLDLKEILRLGKKALVVFLAGTVGVMIGGPIALFVVGSIFPEILLGTGSDEIWRGLGAIAGSWIGGSANQTALKEVFQPSPALFAQMVTVDVIVGNLWTAVLLFGIGRVKQIDKFLKADTTAIDEVRTKIENYKTSVTRIPTTVDELLIIAVGFGATALAYAGASVVMPVMEANREWLVANNLSSVISEFFWVVVLATTVGLVLSFTKARTLEGVGASRIGSILLFFLVATIGMQMNVLEIFKNPILFLIGVVWMSVHAIFVVISAKIMKAPYFFVAVGSQANIGAAASAPIVASAFHPALAPVGVLLAVLGYAIGTYGGWLSALMMQWVFQQF
ncbi:MAG: DUF819 family protein [Cytophagales bacterium]|nr:MAG: DUF819 family protein [Cytophagales bacterium]